MLLEDQARWFMADGVVGQRPLPNYMTWFDPISLKTLAPERVTLMRWW